MSLLRRCSIIEVLLKCLKRFLLHHAAAPPRLDEAQTITKELYEGCSYGDEADGCAPVTDGGVDEDEEGEEEDGREGAYGEPIPQIEISSLAIDHHHSACAGKKKEQDDSHGEHGGQEVHEFEGVGVFLVEVDTGDTAVVHLFEKLPHVGAAFVPHPCFGEEAATETGFEDAYAEIDIFAKTHL